MKVEIEKSEYNRLKSREEKLIAYYEWFVDKENDLATVEDIVNKHIELEEENETLRDTNGDLQRWLKQTEDMLKFQQKENKKLREENEILKEYKLMYEWLIIN